MTIPASVPALLSPRAAVQSIISTYSNNHDACSTTTATRASSRIRAERRYGEDITNSNLLAELKSKKQKKESKSNTISIENPKHRQYQRKQKN